MEWCRRKRQSRKPLGNTIYGLICNKNCCSVRGILPVLLWLVFSPKRPFRNTTIQKAKHIWPPPCITLFVTFSPWILKKSFEKHEKITYYALIFYNINLCFNLQYFFCRRFCTESLLSSCRHSRSSCNGHYSSRYLNLSPQPHWVCLRESKVDKSEFIAWKRHGKNYTAGRELFGTCVKA